MADRSRFFYEARSFSVYFFANAADQVVLNSGSYMRALEDTFGDMQALSLMRPFERFTNLHHFLEAIVQDVLWEPVGNAERLDETTLSRFLKAYSVPHTENDLSGEDEFSAFASESAEFDKAVDGLVDEVFHVLFNDVRFLAAFNSLCAGYIKGWGFEDGLTDADGRLVRVRVPSWTKKAIFHRDKGICRTCKRSLDTITNPIESARYDHIVPLARFGANDLTNLQLLCQECNAKKAAHLVEVSSLYPRAFS